MIRLNEECMTKILWCCIKNIEIDDFGRVSTPCRLLEISRQPELEAYDEVVILYALVKLVEMKYIIINTNDREWDDYTYVIDVTYYGHKYYEKQSQLYYDD